MGLIALSAVIQTVGLQRIKGGKKGDWFVSAVVALVFGLAAVALQIVSCSSCRSSQAASGFASVFVGFYPVVLVMLAGGDDLAGDHGLPARALPAISFVEQPPTYAQAFEVQRFQSALSAFTVVWNYLAIVAIIFWLLFYVR